MAISRQTKETTLVKLQEHFQRMKTLVFTHYQGLTVKEVTELRRTLRQHDVELLVTKKTLLRRAFVQAGFDTTLIDRLDGSLALAFGFGDEIAPAKFLQQYAKSHPAVELLGAIVGTTVMDAGQTVALAALPGRDELRAKVVWVIGSPISGLVNVTAGTLRSLLNVLRAINDQRPAPAGA